MMFSSSINAGRYPVIVVKPRKVIVKRRWLERLLSLRFFPAYVEEYHEVIADDAILRCGDYFYVNQKTFDKLNKLQLRN